MRFLNSLCNMTASSDIRNSRNSSFLPISAENMRSKSWQDFLKVFEYDLLLLFQLLLISSEPVSCLPVLSWLHSTLHLEQWLQASVHTFSSPGLILDVPDPAGGNHWLWASPTLPFSEISTFLFALVISGDNLVFRPALSSTVTTAWASTEDAN